MTASYTHDTLGVCSGCLSDRIAEWVAQFEADHDAEGERYMQHSYLTATKATESWRGRNSVAVLAERVGVSSRRIHAILHVENATTSLSLADEILVALDRVYLLGTLTVYRRTQNKLRGYYGGHICAHNILAVETAARYEAGEAVEPPTKGSGSVEIPTARLVAVQTEKAA